MIIGLLTDSTFQEDPRNTLYGGRDCRKESRDLYSSGLSFQSRYTAADTQLCCGMPVFYHLYNGNDKQHTKINLNTAGNNIKYLVAGTW